MQGGLSPSEVGQVTVEGRLNSQVALDEDLVMILVIAAISLPIGLGLRIVLGKKWWQRFVSVIQVSGRAKNRWDVWVPAATGVLCGTIAIVYCVEGRFYFGAVFVIVAALQVLVIFRALGKKQVRMESR
ncbi:MAG: hypothetical protein JW936_06975 [Sedimentisphaerales bacterium]|nr:hypothetical protein [Sedimentisphaerales bacterium]